ncbi:hypothetical protein Vadar_013817 [Vaccinium darrowii]|uniref:Uncharacterized protein n=1 Tax=Vaccinium darrowii TaxID=229202 RepID=A0ACB7YLG8_9ERIC|nr:hypothetical protein Vadar_013817 [Vaccinium darrowii]
MKVLRSGKILSSVQPSSPFKVPQMETPFEPTTPAKTLHPLSLCSPTSTSSTPVPLGLGSGSVSLPPPRRSLRLASVRGVDGVNPSDSFPTRKRNGGVVVNLIEDRSGCGLVNVGSDGKPRVSGVGVKKARVSSGVGMRDVVAGPLDFETEEGRAFEVMKGEGKRKLGNVVDFSRSELVSKDWSGMGILNLRSGKKVTKRIVEGSGGDVGKLANANNGDVLNKIGLEFDNLGIDENLRGSDYGVKKVRVSDRVGMRNIVMGELDSGSEKGRDEVVSMEDVFSMVDEFTKQEIGSTCGFKSFGEVRGNVVSDEKGGGKQNLGNVVDIRTLEVVSEDWSDKGILNLRSGKKVTKRVGEGSVGDVGKLVHVNNGGVLTCGNGEGGAVIKSEGYLGVMLDNVAVDWGCKLKMPVGDALQKDQTGEENGSGSQSQWRLTEEEKGKWKEFDDDLVEKVDLEEEEEPTADIQEEPTADGYLTGKSRSRLSRQAKGKGKVVEDGLLSYGIHTLKMAPEPNVGDTIKNGVSGAHSLADNVSVNDAGQVAETNIRANVMRGRDHKIRFRDIAKKNALRFAHFPSEEVEENGLIDDAEGEMPGMEAEREVEDWPGPFSTAMKIIRDREMKMNELQQNSCSDESKPASLVWVPKKDHRRDNPKRTIPSLQDLCLLILAKNADAITSLDIVPDILRHKLSKMLCDSRKMNGHFLDLLVHGSATELRIWDCSCLTEEQLMRAFEGCEANNLTVLQLDLCGRCMPDYVLKATLARSPNSLPALTTISLKGAYRLLDIGLSALVVSAPALRSINLSQCSLLTSDGIIIIADSLGSVLRELYIDNCDNIDAVLSLPALLKLEHLEVLSLAGMETVCDDFLCKLVAVRGQHIKELVLSDCKKLTDASLKAIADNCTGLCALDIGNLRKLTDSTMGYLANGCQLIQSLKLCRNSFSDEAVAAYLEASGESLQDLSLYNNKVSRNTAVSLARCSAKLQSLDLSWCRNLADEALGLIVDSCLSLKVLKLFGCTQITNIFLDGHSNPHVQIIGLKTPILEHLKEPDLLEGLLRYSSVPT